MIIGTFTKTKTGQFDGDVQTFGLQAKLSLVPITDPSDKGPHYRAQFSGSELEAGAAWQKLSQAGKSYLSVKLDGPNLENPIYAALTAGDNGYVLNWSRPRPTIDPVAQDDPF